MKVYDQIYSLIFYQSNRNIKAYRSTVKPSTNVLCRVIKHALKPILLSLGSSDHNNSVIKC